MPTTYLPRPDADFGAFAEHFYPAVKVWWIAQGLDLAELGELNAALTAWGSAFPAHIAAQAIAEGARQNKDAARTRLEAAIRPVANFVQTFPATTNGDRADMGITVRRPGGGLPRTPTTRPLVTIAAADRLRHTIRFMDESTPTSRARPRGVIGAEVRLQLVEAGALPPADPAAMPYLMLATDGEAEAEFPLSAEGKKAVYVLRWVAPRGGVGPWSEAYTATVAA